MEAGEPKELLGMAHKLDRVHCSISSAALRSGKLASLHRPSAYPSFLALRTQLIFQELDVSIPSALRQHSRP